MKKRTLAIIVVMVLTMLTVSAALASMVGNMTMYVYTANGKSLNLRAEPNTSAQVIANIPYGATVSVYEPYNDAWYSVGYNGKTGYVMSRFLVSDPPGPKPTHTNSPTPTPSPSDKNTLSNAMFDGFSSASYQVKVQPSSPTGYVNLRWAPSLNASIHSRNYMGDILTVVAVNQKWSQVMDESNNVVGFMMSEFLTLYTGDGESAQEDS